MIYIKVLFGGHEDCGRATVEAGDKSGGHSGWGSRGDIIGHGQDDNHRSGKGKWDSWRLWMRKVKERGESSMTPWALGGRKVPFTKLGKQWESLGEEGTPEVYFEHVKLKMLLNIKSTVKEVRKQIGDVQCA